MTDDVVAAATLRSSLTEALRITRDTEREIFGALDAASRDSPGGDGAWSPKDHLAHLAAWRGHQADILAAARTGEPRPELPGGDIDATNERHHAERADWDWDRVDADADATSALLTSEVSAASDERLADPKVVQSIMGDGPEHDLEHLTAVAAGGGKEGRVAELADTLAALIDRGGWPSRAAAFTRYNIACFDAKAGRLDEARALLRRALADEEELRAFAPTDDDLVTLRDELPTLLD